MTKQQTKNKGGRPPKFESIEKLNLAIQAYLDSCTEKSSMPNKAGLCTALTIVKDTYCDWKKKEHRFSDSIKDFENITENAWVQRLGGNSPTGAIFYLKNAFKEDYKDRYESDITSGGKPIPIYGGASTKVQGHPSDPQGIQPKQED